MAAAILKSEGRVSLGTDTGVANVPLASRGEHLQLATWRRPGIGALPCRAATWSAGSAAGGPAQTSWVVVSETSTSMLKLAANPFLMVPVTGTMFVAKSVPAERCRPRLSWGSLLAIGCYMGRHPSALVVIGVGEEDLGGVPGDRCPGA